MRDVLSMSVPQVVGFANSPCLVLWVAERSSCVELMAMWSCSGGAHPWSSVQDPISLAKVLAPRLPEVPSVELQNQ